MARLPDPEGHCIDIVVLRPAYPDALASWDTSFMSVRLAADTGDGAWSFAAPLTRWTACYTLATWFYAAAAARRLLPEPFKEDGDHLFSLPSLPSFAAQGDT